LFPADLRRFADFFVSAFLLLVFYFALMASQARLARLESIHLFAKSNSMASNTPMKIGGRTFEL